MIEPGRTAPDFAAPAVREGSGAELELFRLVDAHEAVVLLFSPAAFVPAPTAEFAAVRDAGWAAREDLAVVGVTGDSLFAGAAYADRFDLPVPLVADAGGAVADAYGLLADEWDGHAAVPRRATVVVDADWTVRFAEATADAHDEVHPSPVESATRTLAELGIDVERPRVNYDGPW